MKKALRLTALILSVVMMILPLGACKQLDEAKSHHAIYANDSPDKTEILFRGHLYKHFKSPLYGARFIMCGDDWSYVTEKDVPTLLKNRGENLLHADTQDAPNVIAVREKVYYVREDLYDEYTEKLSNVKLDHYYFTQTQWNDDNPGNNWDHDLDQPTYTNVMVDDRLMEIMLETMEDPEALYDMWFDHWIDFDINPCDEDMLMTRGLDTICLTASQSGDAFLVARVYDDGTYRIPDKYIDLFKEFFDPYKENAKINDVTYE